MFKIVTLAVAVLSAMSVVPAYAEVSCQPTFSCTVTTSPPPQPPVYSCTISVTCSKK